MRGGRMLLQWFGDLRPAYNRVQFQVLENMRAPPFNLRWGEVGYIIGLYDLRHVPTNSRVPLP
eukprot:9499943-Pyramimonas_sp.AAC.1